jgi:hypothetical protein
VKNLNLVIKAINNKQQKKIPLQLSIDPSCYAYQPQVVNMTAEPKINLSATASFLSTQLRSPLVQGLLAMPLLIIILLLFAAVAKKTTKERIAEPKKKILKQEGPYPWESMFKVRVSKPAISKLELNWKIFAAVAIIIIIVAALAAATYLVVSKPELLPKLAVNETPARLDISRFMPSPKENVNVTVAKPLSDAKSFLVSLWQYSKTAAANLRFLPANIVIAAVGVLVLLAVAVFVSVALGVRKYGARKTFAYIKSWKKLLVASFVAIIILAAITVAAFVLKAKLQAVTSFLSYARGLAVNYLFYILFGFVILAILIALLLALKSEKSDEKTTRKPKTKKKPKK